MFFFASDYLAWQMLYKQSTLNDINNSQVSKITSYEHNNIFIFYLNPIFLLK